MQFKEESEQASNGVLRKKTTLNMNDYKAFKRIKNISSRYVLG